MESILQPFVETAPAQIQGAFFTPEKEWQRLTTLMNSKNKNIRQTRGAQNSHLIDCVQQHLKSVRNFHAVSHIYLGTALSDYLQKYAVLTPGDWPAQFYNRQLAYNEIYKPAMLRNIAPSMGPLHISLNSTLCESTFISSKHFTSVCLERSLQTNDGLGELHFC